MKPIILPKRPVPEQFKLKTSEECIDTLLLCYLVNLDEPVSKRFKRIKITANNLLDKTDDEIVVGLCLRILATRSTKALKEAMNRLLHPEKALALQEK
jgi:hypothetical protein